MRAGAMETVVNHWRATFLKVLMILGAVALLLPSLPALAADGWWNDGWQYRKKITFDTTPTGADIGENLSDMPVLVRLHSGNFNFTNAREDGGDIRFVAADDATLLKHHIERIDTFDEIALIWVKLPRLPGNSDQGFMYLYYGNRDAMGGQDPGGTFPMFQAAAFHLGEVDGVPRDASPNKNNAALFAGALGLPGVIGNGIALNGPGERMVIAGIPAMDFANGFSLSAWVRINMPQGDAWLFSRQGAAGSLVVGVEGTRVYAAIDTVAGGTFVTDKSTDLPMGAWHLLTVTAAPGGRLAIFLDGIEMTWVNLPATLPALAGDLIVGDPEAGGHGFIGDLDEIGVFTQVLSADRIRAAFASQGPDGLLLSLGTEVAGGGGSGLPIFYLGTILKNITLDGLAIIILLMVLGAVSWAVFLGKAGFLWMIDRDNRQFHGAYQCSADPLALSVDAVAVQNSNLYRMHQAGCRALTGYCELDAAAGTAGQAPARRSASAVKTLRTTLDKHFIDETKRLNGYLTVLTMAITGGPFLGLLGTVWGVMNTFAAMAEAGEANIMAIAPGVASALSTTVVGLIVAIPALFAYNYLTSRIKNITADLIVFADDFALKVENGHGEAQA